METVKDYRTVSVDDIRVNPAALRGLYEDSDQYQNLVVNVGRRGVLQPLIVREKTEGEGDSAVTFFELCDGLHRFSAATANGLTEVPILVESMDDAAVEETQIVLNLHKVDTKPIDYTKHLQRMLMRNPTMTEAELAELISQSPSFVSGRLGLLKLSDEIRELVNNGDIILTNAQALSKLPADEQSQWVEPALTQPPAEFVPATKERIKEIRAAAREGRAANPVSYSHTAKLRKLSEIQDAYERATGHEKEVLGWVIQMDDASVAEGQAAWDAKQKEKADKAARRKTEAAKKKAEDAAAKAEAAQKEVAELLA